MYVLILWTKEKEGQRERMGEEKKKKEKRERGKSHLNNERVMLLALL